MSYSWSCTALVLEPYPNILSQQETTTQQGAAAELLSWQVSPSSEEIVGNQVATSFIVPCQYGFDVSGLGGGLDLVAVGL